MSLLGRDDMQVTSSLRSWVEEYIRNHTCNEASVALWQGMQQLLIIAS